MSNLGYLTPDHFSHSSASPRATSYHLILRLTWLALINNGYDEIRIEPYSKRRLILSLSIASCPCCITLSTSHININPITCVHRGDINALHEQPTPDLLSSTSPIPRLRSGSKLLRRSSRRSKMRSPAADVSGINTNRGQ